MNYERKTIENDLQYLRQISMDVDFENDNYMECIEALREYCENNAVFAMAPVQIGIPKRIIYLRNTTFDMDKNINRNYNEAEVLINPTIIKMKGHTRFLEGCESCLDFVGVVDRPWSVEIEYYDIDGLKHKAVFTGFKATVFCHEYDHLDGILHIDLAIDINQMTWDEKKAYRDENPYQVLSQDGEFVRRKRRI